uniref:Uncharacterized protein n=1 Tax=Triticum urartu TaxID=4572 RepID=A0A8R7TYE1_TRIUA
MSAATKSAQLSSFFISTHFAGLVDMSRRWSVQKLDPRSRDTRE